MPASAGGTGGNVTSVEWQVTLCDRIWHVSSRSGEAKLLLLTAIGVVHKVCHASRGEGESGICDSL